MERATRSARHCVLWSASICILSLGCFLPGCIRNQTRAATEYKVGPTQLGESGVLGHAEASERMRQRQAFLEQHVDDADGEILLTRMRAEKGEDLRQASENWIAVLDRSKNPSRRALIMYFMALGGDRQGLGMLISSLRVCQNEELALEIGSYVESLVSMKGEVLPLEWFMVHDLWPGRNTSWGEAVRLYWEEYWFKAGDRLQFDGKKWVELEVVPKS